MKKLLLFFAMVLILGFESKAAVGDTFQFTNEGQTLTYTVIDEDSKTVRTKSGNFTSPGNIATVALVIPAKVTNNDIEYTVTRIGEWAFYNCSALTSVEIPNSITEIEEYAFYKCAEISSLKIPDSVTLIGRGAFSNCTNLSHLELGNSVTTIGNYAFSGCKSLDSLEIPNSVTDIDEYAFWGCSALTSLNIPNSITYIAEGTFCACTGLTTVTIGDSVKRIGRESFEDCSSLTSVIFGNSVEIIEAAAFRSCNNLASLEIPNTVTSIESFAFSGCTSLTSFNIPFSVNHIGLASFINCLSLLEFNVDENNDTYTSVDGVIYTKDMQTLLMYPGGKTGDLKIPNSVTTIESCACNNCQGLTSVEIPASVTTIGIIAFSRCSNLESIYALPLSPPELLNHNAFDDVASHVTLNVLENCIDAYSTTEGWKDFKKIQGMSAVDDTRFNESDSPALYYNIDGSLINAASLNPGIYIKLQNNKATKILVK